MTFSKYFGFRLKNTALRSIIFSMIILALAVYNLVISNSYKFPTEIERNDAGLFFLAAVLGTLATLIPMLETAAFKSRRNLDTLYSLPIKRSELALAHYLSGLIQVVFIYSVTFFGSYIWLACNTDYYELRPMMLCYILSLLLGAVIYSVFIFLFCYANTVIDGMMISALWVFAGMVLMGALMQVFLFIGVYDLLGMEYGDYAGYTEMGSVYSPIVYLMLRFEKLIEINGGNKLYAPEKMLGYVGWALAGIASVFGYFYNMTRKGAQKTGEISDSFFGYKLLIPIYGYGLIIYFGNSFLISFFALAAMVIGYLVMRRGAKFKLPDFISLAVAVILAVIVH